MAKHKYKNKNTNQAQEISADNNVENVVESSKTDAKNVFVASNNDTVTEEKIVPLTKKAKRRARQEAVEAEIERSSSKEKKVISAAEYNAQRKKVQANRASSAKKTNTRKGVTQKMSAGKRIAAWFRAMKSELKVVTWPKFRSTAKVTGVWNNVGTVVMVVVTFLVILLAIDLGLTALMRLLVSGTTKGMF